MWIEAMNIQTVYQVRNYGVESLDKMYLIGACIILKY